MNKFSEFTVADWLDFLENRHRKEILLGLSRIKRFKQFAAKLCLQQLDAKVITVAGTNGKGSTVAALEAIYHAAGYRVASYTSPHLLRFNERIRLNQQPISDEDLCHAFLFLQQYTDSEALTYFEMTTLAALWHFKQHTLDIIILEVGMGGRFDATNIIDADLSIITTIALDHQDFLGETIEAIAYEKAGILRPNKPGIYADFNLPQSIIDHARSINTTLYCLGTDFSYSQQHDGLHIVNQDHQLVSLPKLTINTKAATAAVMASYYLQDLLSVSSNHWQQALNKLDMPGRQQQVVLDGVTTLFDVAHNPQAVALLAERISQQQPKGRVYAVFSALKDKDLCGLIKPMQIYVDEWYPALLTGKRACDGSVLSAAFTTVINKSPTIYANPLLAYHHALDQAKPGDLIIVYGSFLTVAAIMNVVTVLRNQEKVL